MNPSVIRLLILVVIFASVFVMAEISIGAWRRRTKGATSINKRLRMIEGGIEVAYKSELEAAEDPAAHLEAIRARLNLVRSPFRSAERFSVEDIIESRP